MLRSITRIDYDAPAHLFALTSLTELRISKVTMRSVLRCAPAPSLRVIRYSTRAMRRYECSCKHLRLLTALTSITLDHDFGRSCCEEPRALIARNAALITELKILGKQTESSDSRAAFASMHLPALARLEVSGEPVTRPLILTHAPQLMHLATCLPIDYPALSLPVCTSLDLRPLPQSGLAPVNAPALTSLALCLCPAASFAFPAGFPLTALTSLNLQYSPAGLDLSQLSTCTNLHELVLREEPSALSRLPPQPRLRTLRLMSLAVDDYDYPDFISRLKCTAVTHLSVDLNLVVLGQWPFPHLRKLALYGVRADDKRINRALDRLPRLRSLHVDLISGQCPSAAYLKMLVDRGIDKLSIQVYTSELEQNEAAEEQLAALVRTRPYPWTQVSLDIENTDW